MHPRRSILQLAATFALAAAWMVPACAQPAPVTLPTAASAPAAAATEPSTLPAMTTAPTTERADDPAQPADERTREARAAATAWYAAVTAGDLEKIRASIWLESDDADHNALAAEIAQSIVATKHLGDAARSAYAATGAAMTRELFDATDAAKLADAEVRLRSDRATFTVAGQRRPLLRLRRRASADPWRVVVIDDVDSKPEWLAERTAVTRAMADAINETAAEVAQHRYLTFADASAALQQRLHNVLAGTFKAASPTSTPIFPAKSPQGPNSRPAR